MYADGQIIRRSWRTLVVALAFLSLVAAGCGSDSDDGGDAGGDDGATETSVDADDGSADAGSESTPDSDGSGGDPTDGSDAETVPSDDGGGDDASDSPAAGGETDLGDFPIPAPPGGTVEFDQTPDARVVSYPVSEIDAIVSFYEDWIAAGDWSPPAGAESSVFLIEETGQISGTAFPSDTQLYTIIGTPDGDRIDVALSVQG